MFQGDCPGGKDSNLTVLGYDCITEIMIPCGVQKEVCNSNYHIEEIPMINNISNNLVYLLEEKNE
jgi:hypothetical protein